MLKVIATDLHTTRRRRAAEIVNLLPTAAPRKLTLEDRIEIDELLSEYAQLSDHGSFQQLPALFTHDGVLKVGRAEFAGRAALSEWAASCAAKRPRRSRHQITNVVIRPAATDRATSTATVVVHVAKEGRRDTFVDMVGELRDEFVRTDAGWRFSRRTVVQLADL